MPERRNSLRSDSRKSFAKPLSVTRVLLRFRTLRLVSPSKAQAPADDSGEWHEDKHAETYEKMGLDPFTELADENG